MARDFLLLPTHALSLPAVHQKHPECFSNDPDAPWFGEPPERAKWSDKPITPPWLLIRKETLPDSWGKDIAAQKEHVGGFPGERLVLPAEFAYAAVLHGLATGGEKLCAGYWIRFAVQAADGRWVNAVWVGGQLHVFYSYGGAGGRMGACTVRD